MPAKGTNYRCTKLKDTVAKVSKDKRSADKNAWSEKVNPKRAQTEKERAQLQQNAEAVFHELFGETDPAVDAAIEESVNILAAIGNKILSERQNSATPTADTGENND